MLYGRLYPRDDQEAFPLSGGIVNGTCTKERSTEKGPPLFQNGSLAFEAHDVGWIVCAFFSLVATVASFWLISKHLKWYNNKREQRYIVRILFMVPIYAWVSFGSYVFWNHATPLLLLRDCYESTVLTAFFYLLLVYLAPEPAGQREVMRLDGMSREHDAALRRKGLPPQKWAFPLFWVKWKPADGFYFLQLMKWGILQYAVLRPLTTLAAVILDYMGMYCETSYSPKWGHIYLTAIVSISVTIAMYCLLQLYFSVSERLKPKQPLLKLFAIKAVVFLTFWQATGLGLLITFGFIKNTRYMTADDINTGIGAILEDFEMLIFAFVHFKAFSYRPYKPPMGPDGRAPTPTRRMRALGHAMDFRETFRELWAGSVYMGHRMRGMETEEDRLARRQGMLETAMGKSRAMPVVQSRWNPHAEETNSLHVRMEVEEEAYNHVGERQWLGVGDPYRARREKSEALDDQIERELKKKGYTMRKEPTILPQGHHRGQSSWWRRVYDRLSHTGADADYTQPHAPAATPGTNRRQRRTSRSRARDKASRDFAAPLMTTYEYDDLPPPSTLHMHHDKHRNSTPPRQAGRSGPILTYDQQMELSPVSPGSLGSPQHMSPLAVVEHDARSDSMLGRIFPVSEEGYANRRDVLPPIPSTEQDLPRESPCASASRDRRWTFGADGALNAIAPPASPRSSQDSAFHTARTTLRSTGSPNPSSRRMSYDGVESSHASSNGHQDEFGYRSRSRRSPAEHLSIPYAAPRPPTTKRLSQDVPPPHPSPIFGSVPLSPPRVANASSRTQRMEYATPQHAPRRIVLPAPLADSPQSPLSTNQGTQDSSARRYPQPQRGSYRAPGPFPHDSRSPPRHSFEQYPV